MMKRLVGLLAATVLLVAGQVWAAPPAAIQAPPTIPAPVSHLYGAEACAIGDSYTANGGIPVAGSIVPGQGPYGWANWLAAYSKGRLVLPLPNVFAISGRTTPSMVTEQLPQALASSCQIVLLQGVNNDANLIAYNPANPDDPTTTVGAYRTIIRTLNAAGKKVVAFGGQTRSNAAYTAPLQAYFAQANRRIREWLATYPGDVTWIEPRRVLADPSTGYAVTSLYQGDGVHTNVVGTAANGLLAWQTIQGGFSTSRGVLLSDLLDVYAPASAAYPNPLGNMAPNPSFAATGGTIISTPTGVLTGTAPGSWQLYFNGKAGATYSGTLVATIVTRTDGMPGKQLVVTATNLSGGNANDNVILQWSSLFQATGISGAGIQGVDPGDKIRWAVEAQFTNTAGMTGLIASIKETNGSGSSDLYASFLGDGFTPWPGGTHDLGLQVSPFTIRPAAGGAGRSLTPFVRFSFDTTTPATFEVRIALPSLTKVP